MVNFIHVNDFAYNLIETKNNVAYTQFFLPNPVASQFHFIWKKIFVFPSICISVAMRIFTCSYHCTQTNGTGKDV